MFGKKKQIKSKQENKRSSATSILKFNKSPDAAFKDWTVEKSVKDGYSESGWSYKCISTISKNISSVPFSVVDTLTGEKIPEHNLSILLSNPNTEFSRQDLFELISSWQQLTGEAYLHMVFLNGSPVELWPISPDRIAPVESQENAVLIDYYAEKTNTGSIKRSTEFTKENIIAFKFINPADPIRGIGPLQVAAKTVDTDVEQIAWNKSSMQNRGVLDGVFSFQNNLEEPEYLTIKQKINELFRGKREIGVIGSNAKYQQLSLSPVEMDFLNSRKFNMTEICSVFGVPPELIGSQDSSTFNNINMFRVILWEMTLIPILDDMKSTLNMSLKPYLQEGLHIDYDISEVKALRKDSKEKAETASMYAKIGVPVEQLNEVFKLGIPEYEGWDESIINIQSDNTQNRGSNDLMLKKLQNRNIQDEIEKKEKMAEDHSSEIAKALNIQKNALFEAMDHNEDINSSILNNDAELDVSITDLYIDVAFQSADSIVLDSRAITEDMEQIIEEFLDRESIILTELSLINKFTVEKVIDTIVDGETEGKSINQVQQGIIDSGIFSPERALRIARTSSGTGQSIGQIVAAIDSGATKKTWRDSGFNVRDAHSNRDGETVGINERFSRQFPDSVMPRWPLDQEMSAADRVNCVCTMTFS